MVEAPGVGYAQKLGISGAIEVGLDDLNRIEHPVTVYI
jgi:hypothetical protein